MAMDVRARLAQLANLRPRKFGLKGWEGRNRFNRGMKVALQETVRMWHQRYRPLHFQPIAKTRYPGFARPYRAWMNRVRTQFLLQLRKRGLRLDPSKGDGRPLYESGTLERATRAIRISGTAKKVKGVMKLGRPNVPPELHGAQDDPNLIGWGERNVRTFQELITMTNDAEASEMVSMVEQQLTNILETGRQELRVEVVY